MEAIFVKNVYGFKNSQLVNDAKEDCANSHMMSTSNAIEVGFLILYLHASFRPFGS
jgi:hypothetical protein